MACLPKADLLKPQGDEPELLKFSGHALPPEPTSPVVPFETILNSWALEHPNPKTKDYYTGKCRKLTDLLGYDDAACVTPEEIVKFKEHLLTSGFAPKSVRNVFAGVKTIFRFGVTNRKIVTDPTTGITYKAKRDPKRKRLPFTFDDAKRILTAARNAGLELFLPNLIGALSGARPAEVVEAHTDDVELIDGRWCPHIREDNRDENQTVKTESGVASCHCTKKSFGRASLSTSIRCPAVHCSRSIGRTNITGATTTPQRSTESLSGTWVSQTAARPRCTPSAIMQRRISRMIRS